MSKKSLKKNQPEKQKKLSIDEYIKENNIEVEEEKESILAKNESDLNESKIDASIFSRVSANELTKRQNTSSNKEINSDLFSRKRIDELPEEEELIIEETTPKNIFSNLRKNKVEIEFKEIPHEKKVNLFDRKENNDELMEIEIQKKSFGFERKKVFENEIIIEKNNN